MKRFLHRYYVIELTPLRFHRLYHYVVTPVNILLMLYTLISMFLDTDTLEIFSLLYDTAILVCCILTFIGCFRFKSYAWIAIIVSFALELVYDLLYFVFLAPYGWTGILYALSMVGFRLVLLVLMLIYYLKRQPLFFDPVPLADIPEELR